MRRRLSIAMVCVLVPIAAHAAWDYVESRRLFKAVDTLRQQGEPVSRNALGRWQRPQGGEEMQAARFYAAAGELAYFDWSVANRATGGIKQQPLARANDNFEAVAASRTVSVQVASSLQALIDAHADALAMMDRAAQLRFSRFPPHAFENYPRTYSLEHLAEAGAARTILRASRGDCAGAAGSLWSTLKLRRAHVRTVPWLSEHLIELQYLLEHCRQTPQALQQIQDAFHERERPDATLNSVRETRAIGIEEVFAEWYGRRTDPLTPAAHTRWTWQPWLPLRPWIARQATQALQTWKEVADAAGQPWPRKISALRELASRYPDPTSNQRRLGLLVSTHYLVRGVGDEGVVRDAVRLIHVRSAQAAVAIERFRSDRGGMIPQTLSALVPAYLPAVPEDPFTGEPLRLAVGPDRFVVYSPGSDQKDNGGQVAPLPTRVWKVATPDIGFEIRR